MVNWCSKQFNGVVKIVKFVSDSFRRKRMGMREGRDIAQLVPGDAMETDLYLTKSSVNRTGGNSVQNLTRVKKIFFYC